MGTEFWCYDIGTQKSSHPFTYIYISYHIIYDWQSWFLQPISTCPESQTKPSVFALGLEVHLASHQDPSDISETLWPFLASAISKCFSKQPVAPKCLKSLRKEDEMDEMEPTYPTNWWFHRVATCVFSSTLSRRRQFLSTVVLSYWILIAAQARDPREWIRYFMINLIHN